MFEAIAKFGEREFSIWHDDAEDHVFKVISEAHAFYEASMLKELSRYLKPDNTVVDVGANIGNHAIFFAGVSEANVIAFEPNPRSYSLLLKNAEANKLSERIKARCLALSDSVGLTSWAPSSNPHNLGAATLEPGHDAGDVVLRTMDSELKGLAPRLIKIDTEGMEAHVLRGGLQIIEENRPILCIEAKTFDTFDEILDLLEPYRYLSVSTHNFSPTHVFLCETELVDWSALNLLSRSLAHNYIYLMDRIRETAEKAANSSNPK